jgi:choline-sulfatase
LFSPARVSAPVVTLDLLPTLVGLANADSNAGPDAGAEQPMDVVGPLDGRSLLPHLSGHPDRDEVALEYLAEGAVAPIVMVRRGRHKFIHSPADPDQLFDLVADPDEQVNLAGNRSSADLIARLQREVASRWNIQALDREVRQSQQRRIAVSRALGTGLQTAWDFTPAYDASHRYIRNHMDLTDLEERARYPPVGRDQSEPGHARPA